MLIHRSTVQYNCFCNYWGLIILSLSDLPAHCSCMFSLCACTLYGQGIRTMTSSAGNCPSLILLQPRLCRFHSQPVSHVGCCVLFNVVELLDLIFLMDFNYELRLFFGIFIVMFQQPALLLLMHCKLYIFNCYWFSVSLLFINGRHFSCCLGNHVVILALYISLWYCNL